MALSIPLWPGFVPQKDWLSATGRFTSKDKTNMILCNDKILRCFETRNDGNISPIFEFKFDVSIIFIMKITRNEDDLDLLLTINNIYECFFLTFNTTFDVNQLSLFNYINFHDAQMIKSDKILGVIDSKSTISALLLFNSKVCLIDLHNEMNFCTIKLPVVYGSKIIDLQFLHCCSKPTLAIIHEYSKRRSIIICEIDFTNKSIKLRYQKDDIDITSSIIVPIPLPSGGFIVFGKQEYFYINQKDQYVMKLYSPNGINSIVAFKENPNEELSFILLDSNGSFFKMKLIKTFTCKSSLEKIIQYAEVEPFFNMSLPKSVIFLPNEKILYMSQYMGNSLINYQQISTDKAKGFMQLPDFRSFESFFNLNSIEIDILKCIEDLKLKETTNIVTLSNTVQSLEVIDEMIEETFDFNQINNLDLLSPLLPTNIDKLVHKEPEQSSSFSTSFHRLGGCSDSDSVMDYSDISSNEDWSDYEANNSPKRTCYEPIVLKKINLSANFEDKWFYPICSHLYHQYNLIERENKKLNPGKDKSIFNDIQELYESMITLEEKSNLIASYISEFIQSHGENVKSGEDFKYRIREWKFNFGLNKQVFFMDTLEKVHIFKEGNSNLLKLYNQERFISFDIEYTCRTPQFAATIQLTSFSLGTLIIYPEKLNRADFKLLREIFGNDQVLKIGFAIVNDVKILKIFQIFPVAMIDSQSIISIIMGSVIETPGLGNCVELFLKKKVDKSKQTSNFEQRIDGELPKDLIDYAAADSKLHLQLFFEVVYILQDNLSGNELVLRNEIIIDLLNQAYKKSTLDQLLKDPVFINSNVNKEATWQNIFSKMLENWNLLREKQAIMIILDEFRSRMYQKCAISSKFVMFTNNFVFRLADFILLKQNQTVEKLEYFLQQEINPRINQIVIGQCKVLFEVLMRKKTVQQVAERICCRCYKSSCRSFGSCTNERVQKPNKKHSQLSAQCKLSKNRRINLKKRLNKKMIKGGKAKVEKDAEQNKP